VGSEIAFVLGYVLKVDQYKVVKEFKKRKRKRKTFFVLRDPTSISESGSIHKSLFILLLFFNLK